MVYEAGPTGFGLSRAFASAGIRCEIAAPSKIQHPAGDRVKTESRDAMHLAKLLRLDEIISVAVPWVLWSGSTLVTWSGAGSMSVVI